MTTDCTVTNTLVTMDMAATAASPYSRALKFRAMVDTPTTPWRKKEGIPCLKMVAYTSGFREISRTRTRREPMPRKKKEARMARLTHWLSRVAAPAPPMPMFRPKMNRGSSRMFSTPPVARPITARLASPCHRSRLFRVKASTITGAPTRMYPAYSRA